MPQWNDKDIQYIVDVDDPHRLRPITEGNGNIDITSVSDLNAYVGWVPCFHRSDVLDESKAFDCFEHRHLEVENGLGEVVFSYQKYAKSAIAYVRVGDGSIGTVLDCRVVTKIPRISENKQQQQ